MRKQTLGLVTIVLVMVLLGVSAQVHVAPALAQGATPVPTLPAADSKVTMVRLIHAAPNVPAVDVLLDGATPLVTKLAYGTITPYVTIPAGDHKISLNADGKSIYETDVTLPGATALTLTATGVLDAKDNRAFNVMASIDDLTTPTKGMARVEVLHTSPLDSTVATDNGNPIDIVALDAQSGAITQTLFQDVTFGVQPKDIEIAPGSYRLGVAAPSGETTLIADLKYTFAPDTIYTIIATGYNGSPKVGFKVLFAAVAPAPGYTGLTSATPAK